MTTIKGIIILFFLLISSVGSEALEEQESATDAGAL